VAIGVFLFGTTFLWMTPAMSGSQGQAMNGLGWVAVQILVWLSIAGFSATAWAILKSLSWWLPALAASAALGWPRPWWISSPSEANQEQPM
jgi:hypothetical protein